MKFLAGLGIGFALGVLYAPKSGEELRGEVKDKVNEVADNARGVIDDAKQRVRRGVESVKSSRKPATGTEG